LIHVRRAFEIPLPDGRVLALGPRTLIMGILNVTPDSFADGGRRLDPDRAVAAALEMVEAGADILDIGGESTRPGADPLPADEELARVLPVLEGLRGRVTVPISIDTYKAEVAEWALDGGATIVNDVSALAYDAALGPVIARRRAAVVLMHNRGRSSDMYARARYDGRVMDGVVRELADRLRVAEACGIPAERVILDPGIGFAKRAEHSLEAIADLGRLAALGRPILSGPSRKSFLKAAIGDVEPDAREWATAATVTASILAGAHLVRVHGVAEMRDVVRTADALRLSAPPETVEH
jgi:dihydropteroate synthase